MRRSHHLPKSYTHTLTIPQVIHTTPHQPPRSFIHFSHPLIFQIELQGWAGYRGGLDVRSTYSSCCSCHELHFIVSRTGRSRHPFLQTDGATGTHSVHTVEYGKEIMFHVSTLLPYSRENRQQLERKRHLGNDICNIVFYDGPSEAFDPSMIRSQFNHIFIVVSRTANADYSLKVYTKATVPEFGPALPNPAIFKDPNELRRFIIVKLLNGEKSALSSPMTSFAKKKERTLEALISDICSDTKMMTARKTSRRGAPARNVDDFRAKGQVGNAISSRRWKKDAVFLLPSLPFMSLCWFPSFFSLKSHPVSPFLLRLSLG